MGYKERIDTTLWYLRDDAGPDSIITSDGGSSTLEIPCARPSDAAWYQCTAQNAAGSTATRARLFVESQKGSTGQRSALRFPKPTKVRSPSSSSFSFFFTAHTRDYVEEAHS